MATYKVLQDIEAEDKFIGPLTLKQFIFLGTTALCLYLSFFALSKGVWLVGVLLSPIMVVGGFLGFPWGRDQPTEIWLLAKLRFFLKPRKRIWDQTGLSELVKITAPKHIVQELTDNLSQTEVKSRLQALAQTIDSRGWAVKNVNVNLFNQPAYAGIETQQSDRLVEASSLPQIPTMADVQVGATDDIFSNPHATALASQIAQSTQLHKDDVRQNTQIASVPDEKKTPTPDFWFMNQPSTANSPDGYMTFGTQSILPGQSTSTSMAVDPSPLEEEVLSKSHHKKAEKDQNFSHRRKVLPTSEQPAAAPLTNPSDPAILNLARDNNRNVSSLAREANKMNKRRDLPDDEVVVSLH